MSPSDLTIEILKQIRDGVYETKAEVASLRNELNYRIDATNERLDATNESLEELKQETSELRKAVVLMGRVNDETLRVSLEDMGRVNALEGRVRTLEVQVEELRARPDPA